ncbi:MAG: regulatory protein RecX [Vicinamibacteria bacterium]
MRRGGHPADAVDAVIARLLKARALDDGRYAAAFARSRLAGQGLGRIRIRAGLRARGVGREAVEQGLKQALLDFPETEALDRAARRLLRPRAGEPREKALRRVSAALLRRGFPWRLVRQRLARLQPAWRDILTGSEWEPPEPSGDPEETP